MRSAVVTAPLLWLTMMQQGPQLCPPPHHPSLASKRLHDLSAEGVRGVVDRAAADDSLGECFSLEAGLMLQGHRNLHCHQFHPEGQYLLPSM